MMQLIFLLFKILEIIIRQILKAVHPLMHIFEEIFLTQIPMNIRNQKYTFFFRENNATVRANFFGEVRPEYVHLRKAYTLSLHSKGLWNNQYFQNHKITI